MHWGPEAQRAVKTLLSENILFLSLMILLSKNAFDSFFGTIPCLKVQGKYEVRWRELYSEFVIKYSEMTLPHF